jgi:hypothetical protein
MIRENPIAPFLPLIPEIRNLRRFLVSGINGKNGAMGFFSDNLRLPSKKDESLQFRVSRMLLLHDRHHDHQIRCDLSKAFGTARGTCTLQGIAQTVVQVTRNLADCCSSRGHGEETFWERDV